MTQISLLGLYEPILYSILSGNRKFQTFPICGQLVC